MKNATITLDEPVNALYIKFDDALPVTKTVEQGSGVNLDLDASGQIVGIEILNVSISGITMQ